MAYTINCVTTVGHARVARGGSPVGQWVAVNDPLSAVRTAMQNL